MAEEDTAAATWKVEERSVSGAMRRTVEGEKRVTAAAWRIFMAHIPWTHSYYAIHPAWCF